MAASTELDARFIATLYYQLRWSKHSGLSVKEMLADMPVFSTSDSPILLEPDNAANNADSLTRYLRSLNRQVYQIDGLGLKLVKHVARSQTLYGFLLVPKKLDSRYLVE